LLKIILIINETIEKTQCMIWDLDWKNFFVPKMLVTQMKYKSEFKADLCIIDTYRYTNAWFARIESADLKLKSANN
jgi:hypothetical protein